MVLHPNHAPARHMVRTAATYGTFLSVTALATLMLATAPAVAQDVPTASEAGATVAQAEQTRSFSIPAQPLAAALDALSRQTGLSFAYSTSQLEGVQSQGVSGTLTPRAALARLLSGTGTTFEFTGANTVAITRAGQQDDGVVRTEPISVRAGAVTDPADLPFRTPGSVSYISREQIDRIRPSSPGDIFIETPGVVAAGNHDGTAINVNIRNAQGLNRVRVMVEGTQQESSGYQGYAGPDQRTYMDPELIGGVEISKGPGGGAYSSGTTGGIVNIRLLEADDLIREGRNIGFRVRGGLAGNGIEPRDFSVDGNRDPALVDLAQDDNRFLNGENYFFSLASAFRTDHVDLVAAYARRRDGNYFAGVDGSQFTVVPNYLPGGVIEDRERILSRILPGQEVPNTSEDTESLLLKGALRWNDGQSLEAGYTRYESEFGHVYPSNFTIFTVQQYPLNEVLSNRFWLRYKWESENDLINLQANVWHTNAEELGEFRNPRQENAAWGGEIWNSSFFNTTFGDLTLTYGAEYSTSRTDIPEPALAIGGIQFTPGVLPPTTVNEELPFIFDGDREVFGGYMNAALAPTDWLTLNAGLRYDYFDSQSVSIGSVCRPDGIDAFVNAATPADQFAAFLQLDGFCGSTLVETDNSAGRFSPRAGITIEPLEGLQIFGQYSEGFRAISLVEMGQNFVFGFSPNPELRPEQVQTWEAGINYLHDGLLFEDDEFRAKFVYYDKTYEDYVARTGVERVTEFGFINLFYENIPEANFSGIEANISYDAGFFFTDFTFNKFTNVEYCFVNEFLRDPVSLAPEDARFGCFNRPPSGEWIGNTGQPDYSGSATFGTRLFDEDLVLGARVSFFGEPNHDIPGPEFGTLFEYWPSESIFDVFGSYQFNENIAVSFSVENIANKYYVPPLLVTRLPAPGRTARVNFTATF